MSKKNKKKGFTLIELLVTLTIITIVSGFAIATFVRTMNNSKDKASELALNNLKKAAELYSKEDDGKIKWMTGYKNFQASSEYACMTVQQLINAGYFDEHNFNNDIYNKKNITKNTYLEVTRSLNYSDISVDIKENTMNYSKCLSSAMNKQLENIEINDLRLYTDRIIFRPTFNQHIDNAKFYIKYDNNGEKEDECVNNTCNLGSLIKSTTYPITLCIRNNNDYEYCEKFSGTTYNLKNPTISISDKSTWTKSKVITVNYNKENIYPNEEEYYYYSLAKATVNSGSFYQCQDYKKNCSKTKTNTINVGNWYKVVGDSPKLKVGEASYTISSDKIIKAFISDKTGNSSNKEDNINKIDNTPPNKPTITNPNIRNNIVQWVNKGFKLTVSSKDEDSGIKYYQYTYNADATTTGTDNTKNWVTYSNSNKNTYTTTEFSTQRNQNVYIRVCDNVENCSDKNSTKIQIDTTAPTISGVSYSGLAVNSVSLSISGANDTGGSGIKGYYFYLNSNDIKSNSSASYKFSSVGQNYYYGHGYVLDNAGNKSNVRDSSKFCIAGSYTVPKKNYAVGTQISYACEKWRVIKNNNNDVLLVLDRAITKNEIDIAGIDVNNKSFVGTCNSTVCRLRHCVWSNSNPGSNYCWMSGKPDSVYPDTGNPASIKNRNTDGKAGDVKTKYTWDKSMVKAVLDKYVSNNITLRSAGNNLVTMSFSDGVGNRTGKIRIATRNEAMSANNWGLASHQTAWTLTYISGDASINNSFQTISNVGNTANLIYPIINVKKG